MSGEQQHVAVMHGVNLDQLGRRDPALYGTITLPELEGMIESHARSLGMRASCFQTNHEGAFVEHLHALRGNAHAVLLNPGAWTHYAWAIRDALEIAALPAVEVHLSDPAAREPWRHTSVISELCFATVSGRGPDGYREALDLVHEHLSRGAA
ncbi:MAG TPA: type II 3-dehydroquinate dehydratase [Solirubrobacteraceae bacterium]